MGFGLSGGPRGGYRVLAGVTLPLPLSWLAETSVWVRWKLTFRVEKEKKRLTEMDLRDLVVKTYNRLLLTQKLLNISAEARESATLQYQLAEEQFREGKSFLEELGNAYRYARQFCFRL
ncbi:MAG: TolC family protein [Owenweeksia sp.]|nr:TolC family protein [Owenweeksia sp.]